MWSLDELDKARERRFATRSEAARYAAQVRWGNRGGETAGVEKPTAVAERSALGSRCRDAMDKLEQAGFTVEVYSGDRWSFLAHTQVEDAWSTTMAPIVRTVRSQQATTRDGIGQKAISNMGTSGNESLVVIRHESGAIAGVALLYGPIGGQMRIEYAATSGIVKGAGSAMFGHIAKEASDRGATGLILSAIPSAVSFWGEMGLVASGKADGLTRMGMPSKVFSQLVSEVS